MLFIVSKYAITAFLIVLVSEIAKRSDKLGALIASLPLVTVMVMIWLYIENQGTDKVARHAFYTFWYVLPTLPMFLITPALLHRGLNFWLALGGGIVTTALSFLLMAIIAKHWGVELMP
jgi:F0F1-type ATP synthase assembly protein I